MQALLASILISAAFAQPAQDKSLALLQPSQKPQVVEELHEGTHERDLSEDLPGKTLVEYKGRTAFGKTCHLNLTANAYGDITEGQILSDDVKLKLDARATDFRKVRYHLPSKRMFEIGEEAQVITRVYSMIEEGKNVSIFPVSEEKASQCGISLELRKADGKLIGFVVYRNCTGEFFVHYTMCGRLQRL